MDILSLDGWDVTFCSLDTLCISHKHAWSMPSKSMDPTHICRAPSLCSSVEAGLSLPKKGVSQTGVSLGLVFIHMWV